MHQVSLQGFFFFCVGFFFPLEHYSDFASVKCKVHSPVEKYAIMCYHSWLNHSQFC